ncbi:hypothetical protein [Vibrio marinisediminis]|uniref:hypothetical protein n=1 Tax=Vibrio marinisediminis TaxID=2758441 RepID=UPI001FE7D33C|nr:hypothetical protein [Vibrio marinisediminis]
MKSSVPLKRSLKHHKSALIIGLFLYAFLMSHPSHSLAAEQYAIFSLNNSFEQMSVFKARKLYRGKAKSLNGQRFELADWPADSQEREEFYRYLLGKDTAQMNAHWAALSFSGKARPPKEISNSEIDSLIAWMEQKSNRIGYAPIEAIPTNANVLFVVSEGN